MTLPERAPIGDAVRGLVIRSGGGCVLAADPVMAGEIIASGEHIVRYAVPYLGRPQYAIVPGLIALDYGDILTGEEAWEFLLRRSNLHPRADVIGYRSDGEDDMIAVKWLDVAQPVVVLIYDSPQATIPIARLAALISRDTTGFPPRLLEYLPHYPTITDWQAAQDE
jgi:hypothetical protein